MSDDKDIGILIGKIEGIEQTIDQLSHHIYGNGREGLLQVSTRTQEDVENLSTKIDGVLDLVQANSEQIRKLAEAMENNGNDKNTKAPPGRITLPEALKDKTNVKLIVILLILVVLLIAAADLSAIREFVPFIMP